MDRIHNRSNKVDAEEHAARTLEKPGFSLHESFRKMKQLEVLHLRMAGRITPSLVRSVQGSIGEGNPGETSAHIYLQEEVETDLLVHLHHSPESDGTTKADLGERLASLLREYGMVEHSIWKELG